MKLRANDKQIEAIAARVVDRIQNITSAAIRKADGCNATVTVKLCAEGQADAGMNVAPVAVGTDRVCDKEIPNMLWTIIVILFVLWLIGLLAHVGGGLIHILLVIAVIVLVINLVTGRRAV